MSPSGPRHTNTDEVIAATPPVLPRDAQPPARHDGEPTRTDTLATLRRNEESLRLALEAGQMGSFEWDIRTGEIRWSDNLEAIHGLPLGTFDGTFASFEALIHPEDRAAVLANIRRCVESGTDYETEFRSATPGGAAAHWVQGKGRVFADEQGRPARMLGVCMDVTGRKRAEDALREADRRKDEFLAMISHELRNPLSAIASASVVLDGLGAGNAEVAQVGGVIRRQTEQLTRIVNDLLDISGLTAGKLALKKEPLDLAAVVGRCVSELAGARWLERHRHEIRLVAAPVLGDSVRLQQVVSNLVTNAVKFTPVGGTITVQVEPVGGEAVLRVQDDGVGIPPGFLPRIFDLFSQSERGLERREGGLGLGLAIVRRLVDAHGGRVEARSAGLDQGAELVVRLPLAAGVGARPSSEVPPAAVPAPPTCRRLLIIDDNRDAREALAMVLGLAGHEVHQAEDGLSGLEAALRLRPDAVVVDIGLPGIDGFELARRLRMTGSSPRLIALSGYGYAEYRRRGSEAGFDAYLVKPVDIAALRGELRARTSVSGGE